METLPEDVLICILLFVAPRSLRHASCVCKRWNALLNSEYMKSMRFKERWHNYATGQLLPMHMQPGDEVSAMTVGDDGKVYTCSNNSNEWSISGEGQVKWKIKPGRQMCRTFAVVGERCYIRTGYQLCINDGMTCSYVYCTPWKILSSNGIVYVLCGYSGYSGRHVFCLKESSVINVIYLRDQWLDFAVMGDTLFGARNEGCIVMWKDGVFTELDVPCGDLVVHRNKLYTLCTGVIFIWDGKERSSLLTRGRVLDIAFVGDTMCAISYDMVHVWERTRLVKIMADRPLAILGTDTELIVLKISRRLVKYI
jgi:hypothetical protein